MKPHMEKKPKKYVNVGRSVEEVILRRKFDSTNPTTWPDPLKTSVKSNALPNIPEPVVAKPNAYLSDYPEDDKQKMMDTLMSYCRALQNKVEDLEGQLLSSNNRVAGLMSRSYDFGAGMPRSAEYFNQRNVYTGSAPTSDDRVSRIRIQSPRETSAPGSSASRRTPATPQQADKPSSSSSSSLGASKDSSSQQPMGKIMSAIDVQVLNLKELFRRGDPMDERRACATKIAAVIRGFLARQWVATYRRSLREFTLTRCRMVIFLVDILLSNQSKLDAGFHLLKMNRNMKKLHVVFLKWATVCHQNAPVRRAVRQAAADKIEAKKMELMRQVFRGLHAVSIGDKSTKHANAVRRKLIESIRAELSFKMRTEGNYGVVPEAEIVKVLHRRVVQNFWERKSQILTRFVWKTFVSIVNRSRQSSKNAVYHRFKQLVGRCFLAWSNYIYLVSMGLDRKRWPGPRKYEVKYNQKRVNNFSRVRMLKTIFKAWKGYFSIQYKVKLKFRSKVAQLVASVFRGWKESAANQHRLRLTVYENWKGYARLMVYAPFHAWANHVKAVKNHHNEQIRICNSYVRWKWRQRIIHIVKVWRHQALYGRLDGLYSRQMLLKTLGEQKIMVNSVEKLMAAQTMELEDCRNIVSGEIVKRKELEKVQAANIAEISKLRMTNHNYEQELRKLESVVESMFKINPKQIGYIKEMHPHFKFKERHILLPVRGENDSVTSAISETPSILGAGAELGPVTGEAITATTAGVAEGAAEGSRERSGAASPQHSVTSAVHEEQEGHDDDNHSVVSALSVGSASKSHHQTSATPVPSSVDQAADPSSGASVAAPPSVAASAVSKAATAATASAGSFHTPNSVGGAAARDSPQPTAANTASEGKTGEAAPAASGAPAAPAVAGAEGAAASGANAAGGTVNAAGPGVTAGGQVVSDEDMLLLSRVKWILKRYGDEMKHHETEAHKMPPIDLLLPKEPEEQEDRFGGGAAGEHQPPESEEFDVDSLVLRDRPPLLLQSPKRQTAARGTTPQEGLFEVPLSRQSAAGPALSRLISANRISFSASVSDLGGGGAAGGGGSPPGHYPLLSQASTASFYETGSAAGGYYGSSVSARILLAFMDFLDYGDISMFSECDRRDWIRTLLKKTSESVLMNNEFAGLTGEFPEDVNDVLENRSETPQTPFVPDGFDPASTSLVTLDNNMNGAKSWRDALMQFRCFVNSDPSVIANLKDENVTQTDVAMFGRILAMRDNSEIIMKRQTAKFRAKLKEKITYQFGASASSGMLLPGPESPAVSHEDAIFPKPVLEPAMLGSNIYASNLKLMRNQDTKEGFVSDMQKSVAAGRQMKITDEEEEMNSPLK